MAEQNFTMTVESLFKGMDAFLTSKSVVGEPITLADGTIIIPLIDVSFGVGAGAFCNKERNNAGGGMSGKMMPSSVLVIQNGYARLVRIKAQDTISKLLEMVPDFLDRFTKGDKEKVQEAATDTEVQELFPDDIK